MDEGEQETFDEPPRGVVSGATPRRLYAVIAVLLVIIVVLAIRPWGDAPGTTPPEGDARPTQGSAPESTTTTGYAPDGSPVAAPSPPDAEAALVDTCGSPSGWRAATLQEWAGRSTPIRSWIAIEPVEASGALDPAIPFAPIATGVVTAIGYCAPLEEASRPPLAAVARLWAIEGGQAVRLSLLPIEPASPDALGGLWARPPEVTREPGASAGTDTGVWPPGRYVVELASPGGDYHRWLGIEIADLALLRASVPPSPGPSTTAPGTSATPAPASPSP